MIGAVGGVALGVAAMLAGLLPGVAVGWCLRRWPVLTKVWVEVPLLGLGWLGCTAAGSLILAVAAGARLNELLNPMAAPSVVFGSLLATLAASVFVLAAVVVRGGRPFAPGTLRDCLVAGGVLAPAYMGLAWAYTVLLERLGHTPSAQMVMEAMVGGERWLSVMIALFAIVGAPLLEEGLFRGWLQPRLAEVLPNGAAIALTALAFAVLHLDSPWAVPPILVLAVIAGLLRARTGSVWAGIALHFVNNTMAVAATFAGVGN